MRVTLFTDYSLRVLLYLGAKGSRATIQEITGSFRISKNHLVKVVHVLSQKGYIKSYQGKSGGIELSARPRDLKIGDLVQELEPMDLLECFNVSTNTCPIQGVCLLERSFYEARKSFIQSLNSMTLEDYLSPSAMKDERMRRLGLK